MVELGRRGGTQHLITLLGLIFCLGFFVFLIIGYIFSFLILFLFSFYFDQITLDSKYLIRVVLSFFNYLEECKIGVICF